MSTRATALIARKSIRARFGRLVAIAIAIVVGVSFVVGSFVLADSLRSTFSDLFTQISQNVDYRVRASVAFGDDDVQVTRDPIPQELAEQVAQVEGVASTEPFLQRYAQLIDADGEPITPQGAPTFGVAWTGAEDLSGLYIKGEGVAPSGPGEVAIDKATADREDFEVGDTIQVITDTGTAPYTITALVGLGDSDGFAGATLAAWDVATAQEVMGATGQFDGVDVAVADGADPAAVRTAIEAVLPDGEAEVITRQELVDENEAQLDTFISAFGTGLLIFAFITAFVSAFLINNVFQITIGQRLRELALLRAIGANGRQVRRMIYTEALVVAVIATALGIGGGILVARGLISVFNSAGAGFPSTGTVLLPRTIIVAALVGIGMTLLSVIVPARRAAKIPPVAAMRPELGFEALSARRLVVGTVVTLVGAAMFVVGLFARPGGTIGLIALAGGGGLLIFLGVASVSSTVARPVTRMIGAPVARLLGPPGKLAQQNAGRSPRRTSATAAALMIGVALVSAASVFASSLRETFSSVLRSSVQADYIVTDESFQGLSPTVAEALAQVPEVSAVTAIRGSAALVQGEQKAIGAVDPLPFEQLIDIELREGSYDDLATGLFVHDGPADDLDLQLGDQVDLTFQNGAEVSLPVAGIYDDASLAGNWLVSLDTLEQVNATSTPRDFFVVAKLTEGVTAEAGDRAVRSAMEAFPQAQVQTNAEFREDQEGQIDQLLVIITVLLGFAIVIAVLGISITLALGVFERTREIGLMRAVGMSKRQTRRSVRWEAVIVSTFGAIIGIVVGTLIGVALSLAVPDTVVDRLAFSWFTIALILVLAVVAGFLAALYPSYKASRMNVLQAIATE